LTNQGVVLSYQRLELNQKCNKIKIQTINKMKIKHTRHNKMEIKVWKCKVILHKKTMKSMLNKELI
jgi:hypothetical protein